jgi:hypothetical protein
MKCQEIESSAAPSGQPPRAARHYQKTNSQQPESRRLWKTATSVDPTDRNPFRIVILLGTFIFFQRFLKQQPVLSS